MQADRAPGALVPNARRLDYPIFVRPISHGVFVAVSLAPFLTDTDLVPYASTCRTLHSIWGSTLTRLSQSRAELNNAQNIAPDMEEEEAKIEERPKEEAKIEETPKEETTKIEGDAALSLLQTIHSGAAEECPPHLASHREAWLDSERRTMEAEARGERLIELLPEAKIEETETPEEEAKIWEAFHKWCREELPAPDEAVGSQ